MQDHTHNAHTGVPTANYVIPDGYGSTNERRYTAHTNGIYTGRKGEETRPTNFTYILWKRIN